MDGNGDRQAAGATPEAGGARPHPDASGAAASRVAAGSGGDGTARDASATASDTASASAQATAAADAASRARERFLALVSHELRTPLNGISSWAQVLTHHLERAGDAPDDLVVRALRGIRVGVDQQARLIDDLLDTTMALDGRLRIARQPVALGALVDRVVAAQRDDANARDVALVVDNRLGDRMLSADERRLARAFDHLLDNAIKFASTGGRVAIVAGATDAGAHVRFEDDGEGIPDEIRHALFSPFKPADDTTARRAGGLGIGLALSRLVIELHGGRVAVSDRPGGHGTVVDVELPTIDATRDTLPDAGVPPVARPHAARLADLRILVIDDQAEAREALGMLLRQFGAQVQVSTSVREGLAAASVPTRRPDVVLCDIAMPEADGYAFVQRLREFERCEPLPANAMRRRTPVIALSAFFDVAMPDDPNTDGFDDHLMKPVTVDELVRRIARATGRA